MISFGEFTENSTNVTLALPPTQYNVINSQNGPKISSEFIGVLQYTWNTTFDILSNLCAGYCIHAQVIELCAGS